MIENKKDYSVPENIRKFKPKGTMVKKLSGGYYVYEYTMIKDDITGKRKTKMGKMIGKIKEEFGFVPNHQNLRESEISVLDYGQYSFIFSNTQKVLEKLKEVFGIEDATRIYIIALMHLANSKVNITNLEEYISQSYFVEKYPSLKWGYTSLSTLIDDLGRKQSLPLKFKQKLIDQSSSEIAIDGHAMKSDSKNDELTAYGSKYKKLGGKQLNYLMAYDIKTEAPLTSQFYEGNMVDKTCVQDLLDTYTFIDTLFVIDRGFYSEENLLLFSQNNNKYIIPLGENLNKYKEAATDIKFDSRFKYSKGNKNVIIEYKECESPEGKKLYFYRDISENALRQNDYYNKIDLIEGYTEEEYEEKKELFGTILLETNIENLTAKEIFEKYKDRWKIETFFDYFKNDADIDSIYSQDYYKTEGLAFIFLIVSMIYEEIRKVLSMTNKGLGETLLELKRVKAIKQNGVWKIAKTTNKMKEKMQQLNVTDKII